MKKSSSPASSQYINEVINFLDSQTQFTYKYIDQNLELTQKEDSKKILINFSLVEKVLDRQDVDGSRFIQVNFNQGLKILITKSLVGFKPNDLVGFDLTRIPRVVTTIDLKSVSKAIEDLFDSEESAETKAEIEILKRVYQSILYGAENIGFKMSSEKKWFMSIVLNRAAAAA